MRFAACCAIQSAPSGPVAMPKAPLGGTGSGISVTTPAVVMRPIRLAVFSANHRAPSGPTVIPAGLPPPDGNGNSVTWPAGVMRAMAGGCRA